MVVNLRAKKRLVSRVTGVGIHRIWFDAEHVDDITDAITRDNIRSLLTANTIKIKPFKGTSRGRAKLKKIQKKKRGTTAGSKKGAKGARVGKKEITNPQFWSLYKKVGGNTVRNKAHLRILIEEIKTKKS